jgi:hypothetical protein
LKHQIPVKVFWPRDEQKPDFCETDTVSHDGGSVSGEFCFPVPLKGIDSDNAGEFINATMKTC